MSAEILYPVSEVAAMWRCSTDHIYDLINCGRIRTVNLATGRAKTRIRESDLNAYVTSLATVPPNPHTPPPPPKPRAVRRMTDPTPMPIPPAGPPSIPGPKAA